MSKKKIAVFVVLVVLIILFWGWRVVSEPWGDQAVEFSPWVKTCGEGGTSVRYKYCQFVSPKGSSDQILYLLHGRNLNEQKWEDATYYTGMIQKEWEAHKVLPPRVVAISFGKLWLLTPHAIFGADKSYYDVIVNEAIPQIEGAMGPAKERLLLGESMGGLNSLILSLRSPKLFKRVAALCPPIYSVSPFAPTRELIEMIKRTGADPQTAFLVLRIAGRVVDNEETWMLLSPLHLLEAAKTEDLPRFYVSGDLYDKYGIFEGAQAFVDKALSKGVSLEWRPIYGGHCATDIKSVAEFLTGPRP